VGPSGWVGGGDGSGGLEVGDGLKDRFPEELRSHPGVMNIPGNQGGGKGVALQVDGIQQMREHVPYLGRELSCQDISVQVAPSLVVNARRSGRRPGRLPHVTGMALAGRLRRRLCKIV
jgi:hypothetical protein